LAPPFAGGHRLLGAFRARLPELVGIAAHRDHTAAERCCNLHRRQVLAESAVLVRAVEPGRLADVRSAGVTVAALAARQVKRHRDAVTALEGPHRRANLFDDAAELVAEDARLRQCDADPRPIFLPQVSVAAADAAGLDANDRVFGAGRWRWRGQVVAKLERSAEGGQDCSAHGRSIVFSLAHMTAGPAEAQDRR
jgi:hypothetical protein